MISLQSPSTPFQNLSKWQKINPLKAYGIKEYFGKLEFLEKVAVIFGTLLGVGIFSAYTFRASVDHFIEKQLKTGEKVTTVAASHLPLKTATESSSDLVAARDEIEKLNEKIRKLEGDLDSEKTSSKMKDEQIRISIQYFCEQLIAYEEKLQGKLQEAFTELKKIEGQIGPIDYQLDEEEKGWIEKKIEEITTGDEEKLGKTILNLPKKIRRCQQFVELLNNDATANGNVNLSASIMLDSFVINSQKLKTNIEKIKEAKKHFIAYVNALRLLNKKQLEQKQILEEQIASSAKPIPPPLPPKLPNSSPVKMLKPLTETTAPEISARQGLLAAIKNGTSLNKVDPREKTTTSTDDGTLLNVLMRAVMDRRANLREDEENDDIVREEEW